MAYDPMRPLTWLERTFLGVVLFEAVLIVAGVAYWASTRGAPF